MSMPVQGSPSHEKGSHERVVVSSVNINKSVPFDIFDTDHAAIRCRFLIKL